MYVPTHFKVDERDAILAFIEANAFGQLISQVGGRLFSTHLPIVLSEDKATVYAHVARINPQHKEILGQQVLITLSGPHDYISPSWYASAGVPTWNFQAVHIYGECKTFDDPDRLKAMVDMLTHKYESNFDTPWLPDYPASMLRGIIGIEVTINDIQAKYKLSQNRSTKDRQRVISELESIGSNELASAMRDNEQARSD